MNTVLLCNRDLSAPAIQQACSFPLQQFSELHHPNPKLAKANTPYLLNGHNDAQGKRIQTLLAPAHEERHSPVPNAAPILPGVVAIS